MKTRISLQKSKTINQVYESKNHVISLIQCKVDKTMESPLIMTNKDKNVISIPKLVLNSNIIKRNTTIPINGLSSTNLETIDSMRHEDNHQEKETETKPIVITNIYDQIDDMDYCSESDDSSEDYNNYNCFRMRYKNSISLRKKQSKFSNINVIGNKDNNINKTKKEKQLRDEKYIKPLNKDDEETCHCKCIIY